MTRALSRRRFIAALAATMTAPILIGFAGVHFPRFRSAVLGALLSDLPGARALGQRYVAMAPDDCDGARLAAELFSGFDAPPGSDRPFAQLSRSLSQRRARDFAAGDTVIIDGWIVARTEARVCALASLG